MSDTTITSSPAATDGGGIDRILRYDLAGTGLFVVAMAVAVALRNDRPGQVLIAAVSMALFAGGVATSLWAYTTALERSRTEEVGVTGVFLLSGDTVPRRIRRILWACLATQVVVAFAGATIGAVGLDKNELNALAFGVLVPMFGIGANGIWAARRGTFGSRRNRASQPSNRKIG